jgi:hypothetical protein
VIWKFIHKNERTGRERVETARAGSLHCRIQGNGGYKQPEHPDYEPESFNWYVAPDDEDKAYRRAIADGCTESMDAAKAEVLACLRTEAKAILDDVERMS